MPALVYHENICKNMSPYVNGAYKVQMLLLKGPDVPMKHEDQTNDITSAKHYGKGKDQYTRSI